MDVPITLEVKALRLLRRLASLLLLGGIVSCYPVLVNLLFPLHSRRSKIEATNSKSEAEGVLLLLPFPMYLQFWTMSHCRPQALVVMT